MRSSPREAGGAQIALHLPQMLLHQRLERGVDRGGRGAAIFAHDRDQLVRERVGHAGQLLVEERAERLLVRAVGDRPHQADGDGLELALLERARRTARACRWSSGAHDLALRVDALVDLERVAARDIGRRIVVAVVVRVVLAAFLEHEDVAEAARGQRNAVFAVDCVTTALVARVVP